MKKDWNEFEKNNEIIALNILYVPYNTEEIDICLSQKIIKNRKIK